MKQCIRLIVGLGNPGAQYANTRHNAGVWFVDALADKYHGTLRYESKFNGLFGSVEIDGCRCDLLLPQTYMNLSGEAVIKVAKFYKVSHESILIAHDELDFGPGVTRFKKGGGAGGHNGISSVMSHLGHRDFWRLRIGIGRPKIKDDVVGYVLGTPQKCEFDEIRGALSGVILNVPRIIMGDFEQVMTQLHSSALQK